MNSLKIMCAFNCRNFSKKLVYFSSQKILFQSFSTNLLSNYLPKRRAPEVNKWSFTVARFYHDFEINSKVQDSYRKKDNVSKEYFIIYRAPMLNYVICAHYMSFVSGIFIPCITSLYLAFNGELVFPVYMGNLPFIRGYFDFCMFYIGLYIMIGQIYALVNKYPVRVYSDDKGNYLAVYRHLLPWKDSKHTFKAGETKKSKSFLPWGDSLYDLGNKKGILLEEYFFRPIDLSNMLGKTKNDAFSDEDKK